MGLNISALINQNAVFFSIANANQVKQLSMHTHILETLDVICEIAITKDYIIITTQDPDLRSCISAPLIKNDRSVNNINAYDWSGTHVWNIAELVGDIKASFWGGKVTTKDLIKEHFGIDASKIDETHDLFIGTATNDHLYIIDLTERKLIQKVQTK